MAVRDIYSCPYVVSDSVPIAYLRMHIEVTCAR